MENANRVRGWPKLRSYQKPGAISLANREVKGLWWSTGVGKTVSLLVAWALAGYPMPLIIITKAIGRNVFPRDAGWALGPDYVPAILTGGQQKLNGRHESFGRRTFTSLDLALSEAPAIVTNYEILRERNDELIRVPWKAVIFDEVHEVKGGYKPPKKRDGTLHYFRYHFCKGLSSIAMAQGGLVFSATATPIVDRRRDLFAQLDIVSPGTFGNAWSFLHRYCDAHPGKYGGLETSGTSNTEELMARLRGMFSIVTRADVIDDLPPVTYDNYLVSFDGDMMTHMGGSVETALIRAGEMKKKAVLSKVAECLTSKLKVAVVATRRKLAYSYSMAITGSKFAKKLPRQIRETYLSECVTGAVEPIERAHKVEKFNMKPTGPACLIATMGSIMTSIDLQQTDIVIIASFPVRPGDLYQFLGRFNRIGGRPVTIIFMFAERTIDERYKELVIDKALDVAQMGADTQGDGGALDALQDKEFEDGILSGLRDFLSGDES